MTRQWCHRNIQMEILVPYHFLKKKRWIDARDTYVVNKQPLTLIYSISEKNLLILTCSHVQIKEVEYWGYLVSEIRNCRSYETSRFSPLRWCWFFHETCCVDSSTENGCFSHSIKPFFWSSIKLTVWKIEFVTFKHPENRVSSCGFVPDSIFLRYIGNLKFCSTSSFHFLSGQSSISFFSFVLQTTSLTISLLISSRGFPNFQ